MNGWLVFDDEGTSMRSFKAHAAQLETVSVDWYKCVKGGLLSRQSHPNASEAKEILGTAHTHHVKVYALVANEGFLADSLAKAMESPATMKAHAEKLVQMAVEDGIDGIDLDYESLDAKFRNPYSELVKAVAEAFHRHHKDVVIALHAKESEPGNWDGAIAQDYAAIGKVVDKARIMTYDFHWETGDAGPIGPPDWVEQVMKFAMSVIPARKLDLGIPGYGYDWLGKKAEGFTWDGWLQRLKEHGPAHRDPASQEMTLSYNGRTVFYADALAAKPKFDIVRKLGLNGLALWRLGSEEPKLWDLLRAEQK